MAHQELKPGLYKHYKGGTYRVHFVAQHSETKEKFVVYELVKGNNTKGEYELGSVWIRRLVMFIETVTYKGQRGFRFKYIGREK